MACRQREEQIAPTVEERVGSDHEPACSKLKQGGKGGLELPICTYTHNMNLQPESASRSLYFR